MGDAFILSTLIETGSLAFGLSYDVNLSGLTAASIYPSPSVGLINIATEKEIEAIKSYNSIGTLSLVSTPKSIVINNLTNGIYKVLSLL